MPDVFETHPSTHKRRYKTYFITCTIKLQPEYQHLAKSFSPILKQDHQYHQITIRDFPHLNTYLNQIRNYPLAQILFALITTISPNINSCEHQLINLPEPDWTAKLLNKMSTLPNPPERHIHIEHPYTQFITNNQKIINPPSSIHKELYDFIHQTQNAPSIQTLKLKFPFLPNNLLEETQKIYEPLDEYTHPPPMTHIPPPSQSNTHNYSQQTNIITWNAATLNTALPSLEELALHTNPAIITIQETKLTATKSIKYIQNLFPNYKLIFNNTHALTRCIQQRIPYTPARGGLLTLINHKFAYPGNITKIPTPLKISPYLQIIHIKNHPLQPWLLIHLYMPSHHEDIALIPTIQQTITTQINTYSNHTLILCGDFNRDIALIGRQNEHNTTPPQEEDFAWKTYIDSLSLTYVPTNTNYSRQGGYNYTHTSLIDGFYIKTQNQNLYTCTTITEANLNSDHAPISLHIPQNKLIARHPTPPTLKPIRILNPIPQDNLDKFNTNFHENNAVQLNELDTILSYEHLNPDQWKLACYHMDEITQKISEAIENTCSAPPIPTLNDRISKQGGYLPRKTQKTWKKQVATYHLIRKAIYITKNTPQ